MEKEKMNEILGEVIHEIDIERIRRKNAEFVNLNRIFIQQSQKLKEITAELNSEIERTI